MSKDEFVTLLMMWSTRYSYDQETMKKADFARCANEVIAIIQAKELSDNYLETQDE